MGKLFFNFGNFRGCLFKSRLVLFSLFALLVIGNTALAVDPKISAGAYHVIALKDDGSVLAWGLNNFGQLGTATTTNQSKIPVQVGGISDVTHIAGGGHHTVVIESDDSVWAWGRNSSGQLGNGTITNTYTPVQVVNTNLSGAAEIAAGWYHTLAVKDSDGTVWAWGSNLKGQLGNETVTTSKTPVQVDTLDDVTAISCGVEHSIALRSGKVWTWGSNNVGQLGNGTTDNEGSPVRISALDPENVSAGAAGW